MRPWCLTPRRCNATKDGQHSGDRNGSNILSVKGGISSAWRILNESKPALNIAIMAASSMRHRDTSNRRNFNEEGNWSQSATKPADDTLDRCKSNSTRACKLPERQAEPSKSNPTSVKPQCPKPASTRQGMPQNTVRATTSASTGSGTVPFAQSRWKRHRLKVDAWASAMANAADARFLWKDPPKSTATADRTKRGPLLMSCPRPGPTLIRVEGCFVDASDTQSATQQGSNANAK